MKEYWITSNRFKFIAIILFLMFLFFMLIIYLKADEVTRDPCSICSKRMGEKVVCIIGGIIPQQKVYYFNGTTCEGLRC